MEQHPVPQNVTTFQFRLIGDMTIKQFGYLAGGIIAAYVCYKLPLPFFFTWPLAVTCGLLGFGLAFVPVEERPMDVWIASFFRNIYSPTQWIWSHEASSGSAGQKSVAHKLPVPAAQTSAPRPVSAVQPLNNVPLPLAKPSTHSPAVLPITAPRPTFSTKIATASPPGGNPMVTIHPHVGLIEWLSTLFHDKSKPAPALSPGLSFTDALAFKQTPSIVGTRVRPAIQPQQAPPPLTKPTNAPPVAATTQPTPVPARPPQPPESHDRVTLLQDQLSEMMRDRERLQKELVAMKQHAEGRQPAVPLQPSRQASVMRPPAAPPNPTVRVISPGAATGAGLPRLTTFPNIVTGIIKDQYGNLLSGMLITVRDRNDVPLRALKTNRLGQFAASTPLPNNTYVVEIEDPKASFIFDKAQIQLAGAIAPPLEITAKSQKQVERDKLAKEIFGNQQM